MIQIQCLPNELKKLWMPLIKGPPCIVKMNLALCKIEEFGIFMQGKLIVVIS